MVADIVERTFVALSCPQCDFSFDVQLVEVRTQVWRWCPCCRVQIRLQDADGSVFGGIEEIRTTEKALNKKLGKLLR